MKFGKNSSKNSAREAAPMGRSGSRRSGDLRKTSQGANRRNVWLIVLAALLAVGSVFMFTPPQEKINQGLDIQGGLSVVLTAKSDDGGAVSAETMEKSRAIIESRVNALGASEATVTLQGADQILVQIPGLSDTQEALNTIGKTGQLEFARLDSFTDEQVRSTIDSGGYITQAAVTDSMGNRLPAGEAQRTLEVEEGTYTPIVTGDQIERVTVGKANEAGTEYSVDVRLNPEGAAAFAAATEELAPDHGKIVIILDGIVQSAPAVQSSIPNGEVSITGGYTLDGAKGFATVLESGSLPVSFEYAQSQTVGPTLGQGALASGAAAALIGLALVIVYLVAFYKGLGLVAAAAMAVFSTLYLGLLALLSSFGLFSLSLAGIAGVVLTIGMAADCSILTLERFREEVRHGRSVRAASVSGVRHGIMTSIDANLVSLVSALTLFFLASASVKGFGLTLALGIFCNVLAAAVFIAPLIRLLAPRAIAKHPGFWGVKDSLDASWAYEAEAGAVEPKSVKGRFIKRDIDFLGHRRVFWGIALATVVAVAAIVGVRGMNFGIEFVGGSSAQFHSAQGITTEQMRDAFAEAGAEGASVQTTSTDGREGFLVRIGTTSAEEATRIADDAASSLGIAPGSFEVQTIGPDWGASVIQSSLLAFFASLVLIVAYVSVRFRDVKMGLCSIVALLHVLLVVCGVYVLLGREITPNTIAALLTILGYSLYDTVVAFHRINETMKQGETRCTFMTMANHAINQVLVRSLNTSISSLIPVLAMLLFGGDTLKDFALAMAIGLMFGCYSTIAIASPLYAAWKSREPRYAKLARRYGAQVRRFSFGKLLPDAAAPHAGEAGEGSAAEASHGASRDAAPSSAKIAEADSLADEPVVSSKPAKSKGASRKGGHHRGGKR